MKEKKEEKLQDLRIGDYIFLVWILISIIGIKANLIEEHCIKTNDKEKMKATKTLRIIAIYISLAIYLYFSIKAYNNLRKSINNQNTNQLINSRIKLITTLLLIISSLLLLYLEKRNASEEIELI